MNRPLRIPEHIPPGHIDVIYSNGVNVIWWHDSISQTPYPIGRLDIAGIPADERQGSVAERLRASWNACVGEAVAALKERAKKAGENS